MNADDSMLSCVLQLKPKEWTEVRYTESFVLISLRSSMYEYQNLKNKYFQGITNVLSIQRVQCPFQYGRFKLRQEMLNNYQEEIVFQAIDSINLQTALKYNCDYRRYINSKKYYDDLNKQPLFFKTVEHALEKCNNCKTILVLAQILCFPLKTQSDYYIQYVVEIT